MQIIELSMHLAPDRQPHQHPATLASNNDPAQGLHALKSGPENRVGAIAGDGKRMVEEKEGGRYLPHLRSHPTAMVARIHATHRPTLY